MRMGAHEQKKKSIERVDEVGALLMIAVDCLGQIALRQRNKVWAHEARQLEDTLFEVLERLNDLKEAPLPTFRKEDDGDA